MTRAEMIEKIEIELDKAFAMICRSDALMKALRVDGYSDDDIAFVMEGREEFLAEWKQNTLQNAVLTLLDATLAGAPSCVQ